MKRHKYKVVKMVFAENIKQVFEIEKGDIIYVELTEEATQPMGFTLNNGQG